MFLSHIAYVQEHGPDGGVQQDQHGCHHEHAGHQLPLYLHMKHFLRGPISGIDHKLFPGSNCEILFLWKASWG